MGLAKSVLIKAKKAKEDEQLVLLKLRTTLKYFFKGG